MTVKQQRRSRLFFIVRKIRLELVKAAVILHIAWTADSRRNRLSGSERLGQALYAAVIAKYQIQHIEDVRVIRNIEILANIGIVLHVAHFARHYFAESLSHILHFLHRSHIRLFAAA